MSDTGVHNLGSSEDYQKALKDAGGSLVVIDCFATWCGPCKVIAPKVVELAKEFPNARFYKIDVDQVTDVASELSISAMPTFILFKNQKRIGDVIGAKPDDLKKKVQENYS